MVVCLYWKDLLAERHRPYVECGLRVVTAGHMLDPDFVVRLYNYLPHFSYVTGNEVGTHVMLALEMGIPYFHFGEHPRYVDRTVGDPAMGHGAVGKVIDNEAIMDRNMSRRLYELLPDAAGTPTISTELAELGRFIARLRRATRRRRAAPLHRHGVPGA